MILFPPTGRMSCQRARRSEMSSQVLARHIDGYRRIWMFPRNIRSISPWKVAQMLSLFRRLTDYQGWSGNQELQNNFCKALEGANLKVAGMQYDPHSGGPRTYLAQFKCLGLVFERHDGKIHLTKAGEDIAAGKPPLPIMQNLLLRHQYPSAYSNLQNLKINPYVRVKPFLFILEMLQDERVGYLTNEEMMIPVLYGHNRGCLELCVEKVLKMRKGMDIMSVIGDRERDLYLPRASRQDVAKVIANIRDIGNTCKNYLQSCCLVFSEQLEKKQRIAISPDMQDVIGDAIRDYDVYIPYRDSEEAFQRAYGAWDKAKDTRRIDEAEDIPVVKPEDSIIISQFYKYCGQNIVTDIPDDFVLEMKSSFGFSRQKICDVISPHMSKTLDFYESTFLELSKGGSSTATSFEKVVCALLEQKLLFKADHTGQKRRAGVGGYADIFVVALDDQHCGILDTKASASYALPASDYHAMVNNYMPNYTELTGGRALRLEFASYVAGGFTANINDRLASISREGKVPCSAVSARDLLRLAKSNPSTSGQVHIRKIFRQPRLVDGGRLGVGSSIGKADAYLPVRYDALPERKVLLKAADRLRPGEAYHSEDAGRTI